MNTATIAKQTAAAFVNDKGTEMTIRMTRGKTGISVRASLQVDGQDRAVTGARAKFDLTPEGITDAKAAYAKMRETAVAKGWKRQSKPGVVREDAFTEIPDANSIDAIVAQPTAKAVKAEKVAKNKAAKAKTVAA